MSKAEEAKTVTAIYDGVYYRHTAIAASKRPQIVAALAGKLLICLQCSIHWIVEILKN